MAAYLPNCPSSQPEARHQMRKFIFVFLCFLAGCSSNTNPIGNPLMLPLRAIGNATSNAAYNQARGQVEIFVKTNHPALIADIQRGGGSKLDQAFDIANVAPNVRAPHTLRLQSDLALYNSNLDALVVALMVASS
jgi:hypothetical protein